MIFVRKKCKPLKKEGTCVVFSSILAAYLLLPDRRYKKIPKLEFHVNKPKNVEYVRKKLEDGKLPKVYKDALTGVTIITRG